MNQAEEKEYADMTETELAEIFGRFRVGDEEYGNLLTAINAAEKVAKEKHLEIWVEQWLNEGGWSGVWEVDGRIVGDSPIGEKEEYRRLWNDASEVLASFRAAEEVDTNAAIALADLVEQFMALIPAGAIPLTCYAFCLDDGEGMRLYLVHDSSEDTAWKALAVSLKEEGLATTEDDEEDGLSRGSFKVQAIPLTVNPYYFDLSAIVTKGWRD